MKNLMIVTIFTSSLHAFAIDFNQAINDAEMAQTSVAENMRKRDLSTSKRTQILGTRREIVEVVVESPELSFGKDSIDAEVEFERLELFEKLEELD